MLSGRTALPAAAPPRRVRLGAPLAALVATGLAAGAAVLATWVLAAVLAVEQVAFAWAWGRALRASPGTIPLVAAGAVLADVVLLVSDRHAYGSVAGVIGAAVAVVVLYQLGLRRALTLRAPVAASVGAGAPVGAAPGRAGRPDTAAPSAPAARVSAELATALSGIILVALFTGYLALRAGQGAHHPADLLVIAGLLGAGSAVVAARLFGWAGLAAVPADMLGVAVAVAAGAILGALGPDDLTLNAALATAASGAAVAALVDLVLVRAHEAGSPADEVDAPAGRPAAVLLAAILPLACAAPLVYLVGRHLPG
ncbi:hypothetical protein; putative membrane protein [Frankia alni ACN14a]|uniref:Uncharacterized protein n=1 Tax=Frankia alni (strain DSM 45986 / CECT 9034 / ACN14a) TaxID=326424 RepID=Q0RS60_FRAAA|nr:hypothetical protein; putative membrane protein [Frankia alni ACN14a]